MDDSSHLTRRAATGALLGGSLTGVAGCLTGSGHSDPAEQPSDDVSTTPDPTATTADGIQLGPDAFEDLSRLEVTGATLAANRERHVTGSQCIELQTGSDGAWLHVPLAEPTDFTDAGVACYLAREGTAAGKFPFLELQDRSGNRFRYRTTMRSTGRLVRVDFGAFKPRVDGEVVDLANVTRLSFRPDPTSESGTETVYVDAPSRVGGPDVPKVVFMFDDGNVTDLTEALPILDRYDYPAITYVNTDRVGAEGKLDLEQLRQLRDAGWLVGSHTTDHTDLEQEPDPAVIERTVREAKRWLVGEGFADGARHFAYPYNGVDARAMEIVSRYHDTARVTTWVPIVPSNPQLVPGVGEPTPEQMRRLLDWAVEYGGVVSTYDHHLSGGALERFRGVVEAVRERERAGEVDVVRLDELGVEMAGKSNSMW